MGYDDHCTIYETPNKYKIKMCLGDICYKTYIYMHSSSTNGIIYSSVKVVNIIELNPPKIIQL
jgi:hypothetical protein